MAGPGEDDGRSANDVDPPGAALPLTERTEPQVKTYLSGAPIPAPNPLDDMCRCVTSCEEDPDTACSLSGQPHVHPDDGSDTFGPCPAHPDAPGDL